MTNRGARAKNTLRAPGVIVHWSQIVPAERTGREQVLTEPVHES